LQHVQTVRNLCRTQVSESGWRRSATQNGIIRRAHYKVQDRAPASVANSPRWSVPLIAKLEIDVAVKSLLIMT
jgi:hypothetical protein